MRTPITCSTGRARSASLGAALASSGAPVHLTLGVRRLRAEPRRAHTEAARS